MKKHTKGAVLLECIMYISLTVILTLSLCTSAQYIAEGFWKVVEASSIVPSHDQQN